MQKIIRAGGLAAALILIASARGGAQTSSISVTIAGGPHAGKHELARGQCDALDGQIISMFTPQQAGVPAGPKTPESIELYTEPAKGKVKSDGFAVVMDFRSGSGQRTTYEIYAIPPELQAPGRNKPPKGKGSVTVEQNAQGTRASFRGQTKDGIGMAGSVYCAKHR